MRLFARKQGGIRQQLAGQERNGGTASLPVLYYDQPGYSQQHDCQRSKRESCTSSAYQSGLF